MIFITASFGKISRPPSNQKNGIIRTVSGATEVATTEKLWVKAIVSNIEKGRKLLLGTKWVLFRGRKQSTTAGAGQEVRKDTGRYHYWDVQNAKIFLSKCESFSKGSSYKRKIEDLFLYDGDFWSHEAIKDELFTSRRFNFALILYCLLSSFGLNKIKLISILIKLRI